MVSFMYLYNAVVNDVGHVLWSGAEGVTFFNKRIYKADVGRYV